MSGTTIICDTSTGVSRPIVPASFHQAVFDSLHSLSHPGIRVTQRLLTARYVWPSINADVRRWTRSCLQCQRSKVQSRTVTPMSMFHQGIVSGWIARFGVPSTTTTEHGRQFESTLWEFQMHSYYIISSHCIERFHRQLKAALKAPPTLTTGQMHYPWYYSVFVQL